MGLLDLDPYAPLPAPAAPSPDDDRWARVLAALDQLAAAMRDQPTPAPTVVEIPPVDLTDVVMAVQALKGPATAEEIALALRAVLEPGEPVENGTAIVLEKLAEKLEALDFRLKGVGGASTGGGFASMTVNGAPVTTNNPMPTTSTSGNGLTDTQLRATPVSVSEVGTARTTTPTAVAAGTSVAAWMDEFGRMIVADRDPETGQSQGTTSLRDRLVAMRYTVMSDSIADGLAGFWTQTTASGGTIAVTGGEGLLQTSASAGGTAQLSSTVLRYHPGQVTWLNSAFRFDAGVTGNTRRLGAFTVSGTTPQDGYYFEFADTTLNAVVVKAGVIQSSVASTSWSRVSAAPFTLDTNYHSFELRFTANSVNFLVDNVVRHTFSGTSAPITTTLDFPMTLQNVNSTNATNVVLGIRNIGMGRFGTPPQEYTSGNALADQVGAGAVLTFTFSIPVDFVWVTDIGATTTNVSRVDPFGGTPAAATGIPVLNGAPTPISVVPASSTVKVYAPTGSTIAVYGLRYV